MTLEEHNTRFEPISLGDDLNVHLELLILLDTLQTHFFSVWQGGYPTAIDWTGAVAATFVSATLDSITSSHNSSQERTASFLGLEQLISKYYSHITSYYFVEDAFGIRNQANDDILWVVLGWLSGIKLINAHSSLHYNLTSSTPPTEEQRTIHGKQSTAWHGQQFIPAFAHRSRIFYDLVADQWDTSLCDGGLTWNPKLRTYKNTITNSLFVAAAGEMYLHFPGDPIDSPFASSDNTITTTNTLASSSPSMPSPTLVNSAWSSKPIHDPAHLTAAEAAFEWLLSVNLTNADGLFTDGYHISPNSTTCDLRNEDVWTYNQGVILSGARALHDAQPNLLAMEKYLDSAHRLIRSVIAATHSTPSRTDNSNTHGPLGTAGVLEERCDRAGDCGQDAQLFKGIFFHHLAIFCAPLSSDSEEVSLIHQTHEQRCASYIPWVRRNALAALGTKDAEGVVGGWWGAGADAVPAQGLETAFAVGQQEVVRTADEDSGEDDPNERGRGRTLETHAAGLAVVRCLFDLERWYGRVA